MTMQFLTDNFLIMMMFFSSFLIYIFFFTVAPILKHIHSKFPSNLTDESNLLFKDERLIFFFFHFLYLLCMKRTCGSMECLFPLYKINSVSLC
uniref:Uncharacterized protein n=1 Tax=Anguilla anguilla TaxID=7936 RepID=A0A0E9WLX5_ANGAN